MQHVVVLLANACESNQEHKNLNPTQTQSKPVPVPMVTGDRLSWGKTPKDRQEPCDVLKDDVRILIYRRTQHQNNTNKATPRRHEKREVNCGIG